MIRLELAFTPMLRRSIVLMIGTDSDTINSSRKATRLSAGETRLESMFTEEERCYSGVWASCIPDAHQIEFDDVFLCSGYWIVAELTTNDATGLCALHLSGNKRSLLKTS